MVAGSLLFDRIPPIGCVKGRNLAGNVKLVLDVAGSV